MVHNCKLRRDSISHLPKIFHDAPWNVRLKKRLQKMLLVSENHPITRNILKSRKAVEMESKRQVKNYPGFIIHPLSEFRMFWNILIFVILLLHQILTPFAVGFVLDLHSLDIIIFLDFIICIFLFVEVLLTFRTGVIVKATNEIILDVKLIARNYLAKDCIPDLISCTPFVYILTTVAEKTSKGTVNVGTIILMFGLFVFSFLRFNRILYYFETVPCMLKLSETKTIVFKISLRSLYW